jgi:hypothetical protein
MVLKLKVMSKEQQELLDEGYKNYWGKVSVNNEEDCLVKQEEGSLLKEVRVLYQQEFINKIKTDPEFSEKWGLKIEERELSLEERRKLANHDSEFISPITVESWDRANIPTKQITISYNDKKIESYE